MIATTSDNNSGVPYAQIGYNILGCWYYKHNRMGPKLRMATPGKILLHAFMLAVVLLHGCSMIAGCVAHLSLNSRTVPRVDLDGQVRAIRRRIHGGEDQMQFFILPEGPFLSNVFYAYSLINLTVTDSPITKDRTSILAELKTILTRLRTFEGQSPFCYAQDQALPGGIIYQGNMNRLRAGYVILGGDHPRIVADFHKWSALIAKAFARANPPFPESFSGLTWPVDGVCALDSLRLHDQLYKTDYSLVVGPWLKWLKSHLDPESGLMIAQAGKSPDAIVDGTRGCAMSWTLALLPALDRDCARQQYELFRKQWFVSFGGGLLGIREWYRGKEKPSEFKPGPVIAGLGAAATGFGISAARANGDYASWHRILRSLETFGFPQQTIYGEKTYFFGLSLLSDAIALWGKTQVNWNQDGSSQLRSEMGQQIKDGFPYVQSLLVGTYAILAALIAWRILDLLTSPQFHRPSSTRATILVAVIQAFLFSIWLLTPLLPWMIIIIIMAMTDLFEEMLLRPRLARQIYESR